MSGQDVLRNPKHELYAQARASGMTRAEAAKSVGYSANPGATHDLENRPEIAARIKQLLEGSAKRAELSRKDILDRIFEDWNLARKLGQASAALKAAELMGKEMHHMFVERKEIGGPGDFANKSEEELRDIITQEIKELGWDMPKDDEPKSIN